MISALLVSAGFFVLSVGWYGWRVQSGNSGIWPLPALLFSMAGVVLMTVGFLVI